MSSHAKAAALVIGMSLCLAPAMGQQPAPTTRPMLDVLRDEHTKLIDQEKASLPSKPQMPATRLMRLTIEQDNLVARSVLEPTDGMITTSITGWPGVVFVSIGETETGFINFRHIDLQTPGVVATYTTILAAPDYLQIACDSETPLGTRQVSLIQSLVTADNPDNAVRLTVSNSTELPSALAGEEADEKLSLSAPTFADLLAAHGPEVRKYLLPVLRHLDAASLVRASDPQRAWQVLGERLAPAQHFQNEIESLLRTIDTGDFVARAEAEEKLVNLGPEAAAAVGKVDIKAFGTDARAAMHTLVSRNRPLKPAQVDDAKKDVTFLLDTALLDDPRLVAAAAEQLAVVTGQTLDLSSCTQPSDVTIRVETMRAQLAKQIKSTTRPAR